MTKKTLEAVIVGVLTDKELEEVNNSTQKENPKCPSNTK